MSNIPEAHTHGSSSMKKKSYYSLWKFEGAGWSRHQSIKSLRTRGAGLVDLRGCTSVRGVPHSRLT